MNVIDLSEVARALRAFKYRPLKNTRAIWNTLPPEHQEVWMRNAKRLINNLALSGLTISKARFQPKENGNGK